MGADLICAYLCAKKGNIEKKLDCANIFEKRLMKLEGIVKKAKINKKEWARFEEVAGERSENIREYALLAIDEVKHSVASREVTYLGVGKHLVMLTAGMSWGDDPTDLFQPMWCVSEMPKKILEKAGLF